MTKFNSRTLILALAIALTGVPALADTDRGPLPEATPVISGSARLVDLKSILLTEALGSIAPIKAEAPIRK